MNLINIGGFIMKLFRKKRPVLSERSESKGFTLIELMLVVGIIMVLASLVIVSVSKARSRGRDGKRIADLSTIQLALEMYKDSNGYYPHLHSAPWAESDSPADSWSVLQTKLTNYLYPLPKDPINKNNYRYSVYTSPASTIEYQLTDPDLAENMIRTGYFIRARMEDADNKNAGDWCYYIIGGTATSNGYWHSTDTMCI